MYPQARRRRRRRYLVPVAITALILIGWGATTLRSDTRSMASYFDALVRNATANAATAEGFQQLLATLSSVDRDLVSNRIADLRGELGVAIAEVERSPVPSGAEGAAALFGLAMQEWDGGLADFDMALLEVVDRPSQSETVDGLGAAMQRIAVGDLLYRQFLEESEALRAGLDVAIPSTYPEVRFIPERFASVNAAATIASTAMANASLDLNSDVELSTFSFVPEAVRNTEQELVITATDRVIASVVVANIGNVPRPGGQVRARLEADDGDVLGTWTSRYDELDPRANTTVSFDAMPVEFDSRYVLVLTLLPDQSEENLENNVVEIPFVVNPAS